MSLSNPSMLRTHSLSNADAPYDPYGDTRLRNSSMSLDDKSRTMSRSGSFRDGFEEGQWSPPWGWEGSRGGLGTGTWRFSAFALLGETVVLIAVVLSVESVLEEIHEDHQM